MVGEMYIAQTGYRENREDFYQKTLYVRIKIEKISKKKKNVNIDLTSFWIGDYNVERGFPSFQGTSQCLKFEQTELP